MSTRDVIDIEEVGKEPACGRPGDGATYLLLADGSPGFEAAMRYAVRRAQVVRGHVCLLHVIGSDDFVHWEGVEAQIRAEQRAQAEQYLQDVAQKIQVMSGLCPSLYVREGNAQSVLEQVIHEDPLISALVLGASSNAANSNSLIQHFTGKGITKLSVPLVIVPDHLDEDKIDSVACFSGIE